MQNEVTKLLQIKYPIIQGGMVWCSGYKLAAACSNAGALGLIGAGSMSPELLQEHITKCKQHTQKPFGVNIPLLYKHAPQQIEKALAMGIKIFFTSAGNPATYTQMLKNSGAIVVHVVANTRFAQKAIDAGVDAIVAEGFEAGGHNGKEETTTFCLIPQIVKMSKVPVIAAGGMYNGNSMAAAFALGASAIQVGSRFAACKESSAHLNFKQAVLNANEGDTILTLKEITPVRLLKNEFYNLLLNAYNQGASANELKSILGKGRARAGILEGDLNQGELEIGQVSALINKIESAEEIVNDFINGYNQIINKLPLIN